MNKKILIFLFFIFLGLFIRNIYLAGVFFHDWDEGMYAQIAREVIRNQSLRTTFNGHIWLDKPPLSYAMLAIVFSIFGESEFWGRALMLFFAMILLVVTFLLSKKIANSLFKDRIKLFGNTEKTFLYSLPVLVVASCPIFIDRATLLNTDIMIGLSWVSYFLFRSSFLARVFFLTFGVYSKSVLGFYPLLFEFLYLKKTSFTKQNLIRSVVTLPILLSWYVFGWLKAGDYFIKAHFADQIIKRLAVPIELHFGGKLFYPFLLWENISFLSLILVIGYIIIFFDAMRNIVAGSIRHIIANVGKFYRSSHWWDYLILFSGIPFFVLLIFQKTKISWYLASVIPLMALAIMPVYVILPTSRIRLMFVTVVASFFLWRFIPLTYAFSLNNYTASDKTKMARCLSSHGSGKIAFLVDEQERKNRNVVEAAQLSTESSFLFGGSPSFVFYANKPVKFFYKPNEFARDMLGYRFIVLTKSDEENEPAIHLQLNAARLLSDCSLEPWHVYEKK